MAKLIYGMGQVSLDGYVAGPDGNFDWVTPGEDLHHHAGVELVTTGTAIYGRKMYDLLVFWETADKLPDMPPAGVEFSLSWQSLDKIVVSETLGEPTSKRTRVVPRLSLEGMHKLKADATKPISIAGPTTASPFLNAGLVDKVTGYFIPYVSGGGLPLFK